MTADDEMEEDKVKQERGENDNDSMNISELNLSRESNKELTTSPAQQNRFPQQQPLQSTRFPSFPSLEAQQLGQQQAGDVGVSQLALDLFGRSSQTLGQYPLQGNQLSIGGQQQPFQPQQFLGHQLLQQQALLPQQMMFKVGGKAGGFDLYRGFGEGNSAQFSFGDRIQAAHTAAALPSDSVSPAPPAPPPTQTATVATAPGVGNYDNLNLGPGGAFATASAATAALSLKERRPVNPPSVAVSVQQYGGGAAVLPEIHVPEAHDIHVPAPVAPAFPVRRLPASVYVPEQQQQAGFELFNALNPHRARKPALGRDPGPVLGVVAEARERCIV